MPSRKVLRIASRIKFLLSELIQRGMADPRLGFVTILEVEVSEDLAEARVQFSVLGSRGECTKTVHALEDARGYLQRQVGKGLQTRTTPALKFVLDETAKKQERIEELLKEARRQEESPPPEDTDESETPED